jgi:hypothetical protein
MRATQNRSAKACRNCASITARDTAFIFVKRGEVLFVLLCGGDKSSQARDIVIAKRFAAELKERR